MKSIHDRPYYKKVYKKDSKNLKILIGHGSKQPKHAKKGAPYTQNPQKRRPVNKLSAPLMALDEAISEDFKTRFNEIKQATFSVKMKKKVDPYYITILDKEKTYNGIIKDNNITIRNTEQGPITKTKKEFLDKLAEYGELCNVVYCDDSTITIGTKTSTFSEMLKPVEKKPEQQQKQPKQLGDKRKIKDIQAEDEMLANNVSKNIGDGSKGSIEKAVKAEFGTGPAATKFSKKFASLAIKGLEKIKDPNEKKRQALIAVIFGSISAVGVGIASQVPFASEISDIMSDLTGVLGGEIEKLQNLFNKAKKEAEIIKKKIDKGIEFAKKLTGGNSLSALPNGDGKKVIFLGNSQTHRTYKVLNKALIARNYESTRLYSSGKFDLVHTGDNPEAHPSYYHKGSTGYKTIESLTKELGGADKIGLISINLGDSQKPKTWEAATETMIKDLRELIPNVAILWIGAPPIQKAVPKTNAKRKQNTLDAKKAVIRNGGVFINPFDYFDVSIVDYSLFYAKDPVKVHLNEAGILKILSGNIAKKLKVEIKADSVAAMAKIASDEQRQNAAIIEREFIAAGYSKNVVAAAIANSSWESGLGKNPIGDGGASVGLFHINRPAHKRRIKPANDKAFL